MVSLADLRSRNVQPVWQEAVAVVQELIQSATASGTPLPDLEHIALIENGDVVAMPGSPEPTDPVRQAATMLRVMIDGIAVPPELDEFVKKNLSGAAAPTLAEFSRGLSFYERPGRRSDVERLVARVAAAEQLTRADEELRRLKEKAAEASESRLEDTVFMDTVAMQRNTRPVTAVAGVALVAVVAAGAWWWWRDRTTAPQPSASAAASTTATVDRSASAAASTTASTSAAGAATVDKTADKSATTPSGGGASALPGGGVAPAPQASNASSAPKPGTPSAPATASPSMAQPAAAAAGHAPSTLPPFEKGAAPHAAVAEPSLFDRAKAAVQSAVNSIVGPAPEAEHAAATAPAAPETAAASKKSRHPKPAAPVPAPAAEIKSAVVVAVDEPTPPLAPLPTPVETTAVVIDDNVYSSRDAAVLPPVLVRPVLPKDPPPGVPDADIGTIEILVNEQGDVQQVKLVSPANRFPEKMLVSAAKMWKFRPAFKDGHPVRYLARVRLTV
jgi:hypothetical protein